MDQERQLERILDGQEKILREVVANTAKTEMIREEVGRVREDLGALADKHDATWREVQENKHEIKAIKERDMKRDAALAGTGGVGGSVLTILGERFISWLFGNGGH